MSKKVNKDRGYWQTEKPFHKTDVGLKKELVNFCHTKDIDSVVDFGCGDASYIRHIFNTKDLEYCDAYDGNPNVAKISDGFGKQQDLSVSFDLEKKFDLVLSLEVAEHIPKKYEIIYVSNLLNHCKKHLIISWAIMGQGGTGHFNEQNYVYVVNLFSSHGFTFDELETQKLRRSVSRLHWFRNSLLYFNLTTASKDKGASIHLLHHNHLLDPQR